MFDNPIAVTFCGYLFLMITLGFCAYFYTRNFNDYILGGRRVGGVITALSVGASDMSGWLLMGVPGAAYAAGLCESWIAIGLTLGTYFNWRLVSARLRLYTELEHNSLTLPDFFTHRFNDKSRWLRIISAIVILIFFTIYCSSGMVAGARLFESTFDMPYSTAIWLTPGYRVFWQEVLSKPFSISTSTARYGFLTTMPSTEALRPFLCSFCGHKYPGASVCSEPK